MNKKDKKKPLDYQSEERIPELIVRANKIGLIILIPLAIYFLIFYRIERKITIPGIIKSGKDNLVVNCYIPEHLSVYIKEKQNVYIKSYQYNKSGTYNGIVEDISDHGIIINDTGKVKFKVIVKLLNGLDKLKKNSSVQCEIIRDKVSLLYFLFIKD